MSEKENKNLPHVLIEVHINKDKEIESTLIISEFVGGESGKNLKYSDDFEEYSLKSAGLLNNAEPNTLYHVYARIDWYECGGYDCREWDSEVTILNVIPVISNYEEFLEEQEDFKEQEKLAEYDSPIESIDIDGEGEWSWTVHPIITHDEYASLAKIVVQHDVRLAHRLYNTSNLAELLGEFYDSHLEKIEKRRLSFKHFIRRNDRYSTCFTKEGYEIKYWGKTINISFDVINSIPDELLLANDYNEALLKKLLDEGYAPFIMEELLKYN